MKLDEAMKQIEEQLKECAIDCDCECSMGDEEMEDGKELMFSDEGGEEREVAYDVPAGRPTSERGTIDPNQMNEGYVPYQSVYKMMEENPCQAPASYSPSAAAKFGPSKGCVTKEGKPGKFAPGYRPDPKKGFVKVDPNAMKTGGTKGADDDISETQHWSGQPKH